MEKVDSAARLRSRAGFFAVVLACAFGCGSAQATTLTGRVTRAEDGTPVVGAHVVAVGAFGGPTETQTDADGRYAFDFLCGSPTCSVSATADGYVRDGVSFPAASTAFPADFALVREAVISGRVVLPAGAGTLLDGPEVERYDEATGEWRFFGVADASVAGDIYRYSKLRAGTYRLCYQHESLMRQCFDGYDQGPGPAVAFTPVVLAAGDTRNEVNFSPRSGAVVTGRIYDGYRNDAFDGPRDLYVWVYSGSDDTFLQAISVRTAADGRYAISSLAPGSYYLIVAYDRYLRRVWPAGDCLTEECDPPVHGSPLTVPASGTVENIDFALQAYAAVRARVVDASTGALVPGALMSSWLWVFGGAARAQNDWYDAATDEHVSYSGELGERIGAVADGYVSRFVVGGNCVHLPTCALRYPMLVLARGEVRRVTLRLSRSDSYLFANDFD